MLFLASAGTMTPKESTIKVKSGSQAQLKVMFTPQHGHNTDWISVYFTERENVYPFELLWSDVAGMTNTTFSSGIVEKVKYERNKMVEVSLLRVVHSVTTYMTAVFTDDKTDVIKTGPLYSKFVITVV